MRIMLNWTLVEQKYTFLTFFALIRLYQGAFVYTKVCEYYYSHPLCGRVRKNNEINKLNAGAVVYTVSSDIIS